MRKFALLIWAVVMGWSSGAFAATLDVVGGQLLGASNVNVGGTLYNVQFIDGTCVALFNGCNEASDFTFTEPVSALAAAQALLDQVFLDGPSGSFDSIPYLTNGCTDPGECNALTPYDPQLSQVYLYTAEGVNYAAGSPLADFTKLVDYRYNYVDYSISPPSGLDDSVNVTYAVWTLVPEPTTALLLTLGLAGLGMRRRVR